MMGRMEAWVTPNERLGISDVGALPGIQPAGQQKS